MEKIPPGTTGSEDCPKVSTQRKRRRNSSPDSLERSPSRKQRKISESTTDNKIQSTDETHNAGE